MISSLEGFVMGRLVTPLSAEEYEKLPGWQKWLGRNVLWVLPLGLLAVLLGAVALVGLFE